MANTELGLRESLLECLSLIEAQKRLLQAYRCGTTAPGWALDALVNREEIITKARAAVDASAAHDVPIPIPALAHLSGPTREQRERVSPTPRVEYDDEPRPPPDGVPGQVGWRRR